MSGVLNVGRTALLAAQAGLTVTSNNIANVNTPGYSRQEVLTSAQPLGLGTRVDSVRRIYSDFLAAELRRSQANASFQSTRDQALGRLDNLFGETSTALGPALDDFFSATNAVAANPADVSARQLFLGAARTLASRLNTEAGQMAEVREGLTTQIVAQVREINGYAAEIASLNRSIAVQTAGSETGQVPNELLDQRDQLVLKLNERIGATATAQPDGTLNISLSNGQALVVGEQVYTLQVGASPLNPDDVAVGLNSSAGFVPYSAGDLAGGTLGGLLNFRDTELDFAQNTIGRIALVVGQTVNAQNRLGLDLQGLAGGDIFRVPGPNAVTLSGSATLSVSVADTSAITTSDYRLDFDGTNFRVMRIPEGTTVTIPPGGTVDGLTVNVGSGTLAAGDRFLIEPTRAAAANIAVSITDPLRIAAAAPVRTAAVSSNRGSGTISAGAVDSGYLATPLTTPVTFSFTGASTFTTTVATTVTVGSTTTAYAAGASIPYTEGAKVSFGGISFTLAGTPASGDQFTVGPNAGASGDNRNAVLMAAMSSAKLIAGGTTTLGGSYGQLISYVGAASRETSIRAEAQASILGQAQDAYLSVSGVNLDEEAINLQRYQQAYQAAAKVMVVASSLFDTLLQMGG